MRRILLACYVAVLGLHISSLHAQEVKPSPRVLLSFEKTRFKSALIEAMNARLQQAGLQVTVVEHSKRGLDADAAAFDAVFITNSGVNSKVRPWIVEWLAANKAHRAKILLHTTQTRDWQVQVEVDAVTSASSMQDVDALATRYVQRLRAILGD